MADPEKNPTEYVPEKYRVEFDASQYGPEVQLACPKCDRQIGPVRLGEDTEVLCASCGILYKAELQGQSMELRVSRRVVITDDSGRYSPGQAINRPDMVQGPSARERINMLLWALAMTGLMMAGLWAVMRYFAR